MRFATFNPAAEHTGGCFSCRYFGERVDVVVWCAQPGGEHHRSQAHLGCAFWECQPGADDDLPMPKPPARAIIAPMLLTCADAAVRLAPVSFVRPASAMPTRKKAPLTKTTSVTVYADGEHWNVRFGKLKRGRGHPGKAQHLFRVVAEKLPYESLSDVKAHMKSNSLPNQGIYVAHDSMGCPRYIGRGAIFRRLGSRKRRQAHELTYYSFYVVSEKKHEREIETLLIRAAGFLLEFNDRKKRVGIAHGNVRDFEAGTLFYERQHRRG